LRDIFLGFGSFSASTLRAGAALAIEGFFGGGDFFLTGSFGIAAAIGLEG
jgi:hypothetical protein